MPRFKKILVFTLAAAGILLATGTAAILLQGPLPQDNHQRFREHGIALHWDDDGIPTIRAKSWEDMTWAQGYIQASQRLWQMELMRRAGEGSLSELFGSAALPYDSSQVIHDWAATARSAADRLPETERKICASYAQGVNDFITDAPFRWGLEFLVVRAQPRPWQCADTMLVYLSLAKDLSDSADQDWREMPWRQNLNPAWLRFLFGHHPKAEPMFGDIPPEEKPPQMPAAGEFLPPASATSYLERALRQAPGSDPIAGSNSWAYTGGGNLFLANDPHLLRRVPSLWFALRAKFPQGHWVAGVSLPGIPGVVLGMNEHYAWAFTNAMEDVDDYLIEELDVEGRNYRLADGSWRLAETKEFTVRVAGQTQPVTVKGLFTHRGPLLQK